MNKKTISIMTPCLNEEDNIEDVYREVQRILTTSLPEYNYEHLFIDNCSTDRTPEILRQLASQDHRVKVIYNSRNFGPHRSPYYALMMTSGDAVIPIMADLQDDPELIPMMVEKWCQGTSMVLGVRKTSEEVWFVHSIRKIYYRFIKKISNIDMILNFTGFGLYDRRVIDVLRQMDEPNPYFRGLVSEIGFDKQFFQYDQRLRKKGKSKNGFRALLDYAILAVILYSQLPYRGALYLGLIGGFFSFVGLVASSFTSAVTWKECIFLFFLSALVFLCGLLGESLGQMMIYARRRPLVLERERLNFDQDPLRREYANGTHSELR